MGYVLLSRAQQTAVTQAQRHRLHSLRDVINSKVRVSFENFRWTGVIAFESVD
jgi:hypothetical protein